LGKTFICLRCLLAKETVCTEGLTYWQWLSKSKLIE